MIRRVCGVVLGCALLSGAAFGAQVNEATATGGTGTNATSTKPYPSGLTATYTVGGANVQIVSNNAPLTALGGATAAMFTPAIPTTTTAVQLQVAGTACSFASNVATSVVCPALGTLQVSFSRPVTNPVLHIVGIGSVRSITGDTVTVTASRVTHAIASSVPAGASMTLLPNAVNLQTLVGGTELDLVNAVYNGTNCSAITAPATQNGGCGSVRINGTVSSVTLSLGLAGTRNVFNATIGNNLGDEGYLITASVDEDFGDAPASYDGSEAASHIVDGIRLGASIDADNSAVLNGTPALATSPNAVAAGADNNGAAGDGADENGLVTPLATLHTGLIGQTYTLTPALTGSTAAGTVCGWIDFNRNGVFESAEGVCTPVASGATSAPLQWTVPVATTAGRSYVRLRATQGTQLSTATPTGRVDSGEVEDYMVEIKPAVRVIKSLSPTTDTGRFDLSIGGTVFSSNTGHNGTTGFRTLYHSSASGAPDLTVAQNIATNAVTTTVAEAPTPATTGTYTSTYSCVNGAGITVATGNGTSVNLTLPVSVTGAAANGRAQAVACAFTNTAAALPTAAVVSLNRASGNPTRNATVTWTLLFDQPISGLTAANLALANGGLGGAPAIVGVGPSGSEPDTQWNVTASTGTGTGTLGLNLANDTGLNRDITNVPFTGQVFNVDRSPPTVTITVADTLLTAGETSPVTFVFNEVVDQLPAANITVENGTLSTPTTADNITWTATLTPTAGIDDPSNVITLNLTGTSDVAGNAGVGTTPSNNYAIDNVIPVVCPANVPTPFSQNWSNTGLITANDDWSGVLGFTGYLGDIASATGANPTTLTGAALGAVDVIANVTAVTNTAGGVAEMQIANAVVALQGSNAATTPSLVMTLDTTGSTQLTLAYSVRDIDSTTDNAVQPFNAQYRIGSSGTWTNLPGTYIADASVGPSLVQDTPVSITLPALLNNVGVVQIRFMTNNASGNDEWLGVDDIVVTPLCIAPAGATIVESGGSTTAVEGGADDTYTLRLDAPPSGDVTIAVDAGAQLAASPGTLTFTTTNWGTPQTVNVTAVDDRTVEGSPHAGSITHTASGGSYDGVVIAAVNVGITDNDSATYQFAAATGSSSEAAGTANIAVTTTFTTPGTGTQRFEQAITLPYSLGGTASGGGVDYSVAGSVTVPVSGASTNIVVTLVNDGTFEPNETIVLTLGNETTSPTLARQDAVVTPGAVATHTHTIVDSSPAPQTVTVQFNAATSNAPEAAGFGNLLRVTTSDGNPTGTAATVTIAVTGGSASAADYNLSGTVTIPAGTANNALVSIASGITVINETLVEPNETVQLTLSNAVGATLAAPTTTHTISNDDVATVTVADVAQAEGNAGTSTMTFSVTLDNPVQGGFALDYTTANLTASVADNDYVSANGTLTFSGTSGETETLAVTINGDTKVEPSETFRIAFPSALASVAPGALIITDTATGTITNDDDARLTIADVSIVEGNAGTSNLIFTVTLDNAVQGGFTANYATANGTATTADADYTAATGTLTFAGAAGETQTFAVTVSGDTKVEANETLSVSLNTVSNAGVDITDTATGTITNDDNARLTIADVAIAEGNAGTSNMIFTVTLDNAVQGGFTANYATTNGTATTADADYVAATGTLSFTGAAGQTRTFVVTANGDTKIEPNETFSVSLNTVSNAGVDITDTAIGTINNDDSGAVTIANVSQPENGTFTFTATLSSATSAPFSVDWTLAAATTNAADYVGSVLPTGGTLNFTGTAGETRTFTVPVRDDAVSEPNETFTVGMVNFTTSGGFSLDTTDTATGTIVDNDAAGYVVDTASVTGISEPDTATSFTVRLASEPSGTVIVGFASTDATECVVSPTSFTFTPGNWNVAQTIAITAVDDLIVDGTQPCAATITRSGGTATEFAAIANPANVAVNVADNDTAGITVTPTTVAIGESGGTVNVTIAANTAPQGNVFLPLTTDGQCEVDAGAGFGNTATVTLPAGSTAPQTVAVRAVNDTVIEGAHTCAITTGNPTSATDAAYDALTAGNVADVTANVADNDVLHSLSAGAGGAEGTGTNPAYSFTITRNGATNVASSVNYSIGGTGVAGTDYGAVVISGAGVTSTPTTIAFAANATTATVAITVNGDSIAEPNFTLGLTLAAATADGGAGTGTIAGSPASLTVTDDDVAGYVVDTSATAASIAEPSGSTTFTVRLTSQPAGTVILDLGSTDPTECAVSPATFTFNAGNWNAAQTITIAAADDALVDGTQPCAATIARSGGSAVEYASVANPANVALNVTDDDAIGVTVTPTAVTATEGGATGSYTVVLDSQPSGTVAIAISGDAQVSTAPTTLQFTAATWNNAQTVTVTAIDDPIAEGSHTGAITHAASGADYAGVPVAGVAVDITDNDAGGIVVMPIAGLDTKEAGGTATFTVVLASEPTAAVSIALSSSDTGEGTVAPATLSFDDGNWNVAQTVTVTGVDDDVADGDIAYTIVTAAAVSADPTYTGFDAADVAVINRDDDNIAVIVTPTTIAATEGGTGGAYSIALASEPTGTVTITVTADAQVTATPVALQFTAADWNVAQTVAVTAVDDAIAEGNHTGTITHAASGADYAGAPVASVNVDIADNDSGGIVVTPTAGLETTEAGGNATFTVVLASEPTAAVSLALSSSDTSEGNVAPATLSFDASNWSVARTVTVSGIDDDVADGDVPYSIVTAAAVSGDATYDGVDAADIAVINRDDDSIGVTITPTTIAASEGGAGGSYTVVLDSEPTGAVSIAITADAQVTTTPTTLQFTAADWDVAQTVTVAAVDDAIAEGSHTGTITHTASGADYAGATVASVTVDITDNDSGGIVVTPTSGLQTTEAGGTATFTAVLASEPTADVSIALSSSDVGEGTVAPAALAFDASNWNVPQTVTVTGVDDALVDGDVPYTILTAAAVSVDASYGGVDADDVAVTNTDDDSASLRIDDVSLDEGDSGSTAFVFTVTLDGAIDGGVSVAYATADASAAATTDYTATNGTLAFTGTDGETRTISVPVSGDTLVEGDETFTVTLATPNPASVTLARAVATATVRNDDGAAQLAASKRVTRIGTASVPVRYEIVLRNTGAGAQADDPASDELVDVLPSGLALRTATATAGTLGVDLPGNTVRWNGALAAGASVTLLIEADVVATTSGPISNRASIRFDSDGDGENDTDSLSDNPDTIEVDDTVFEYVAGGVNPSAPDPQVIPALDAWTLLWLSFGLGVFGLWSIRRQR